VSHTWEPLDNLTNCDSPSSEQPAAPGPAPGPPSASTAGPGRAEAGPGLRRRGSPARPGDLGVALVGLLVADSGRVAAQPGPHRRALPSLSESAPPGPPAGPQPSRGQCLLPADLRVGAAAARRNRCSTPGPPPITASAGRGAALPRSRRGRRGLSRVATPPRGPGLGGGPRLPSESPAPDCNVQFGRWAVTAACCAGRSGWPGPCGPGIRVGPGQSLCKGS
jgi:hypothetical protein